MLRPPFQDFVNSVALLAAEPVVEEIRVVNDLSDQANLLVADVKLFGERFKRAIVAAMSEPFLVEHVVGHRARRHAAFGREGKPRLPVDKTVNQPGGRAAVDTGPWPRHPSSALVVLWIDLAASGP